MSANIEVLMLLIYQRRIFYLWGGLAILLSVLLPVGSAADILLRFPSGTGTDEIVAYTKAFEEVGGVAARGVTPITSGINETLKPSLEAEDALKAARQAYKNLDLDSASSKLQAAEDLCFADQSTAACRKLFFETNVLKGAIGLARGKEAAAAHAFLTAHAILSSQVMDPRRFPPKTVGSFNKICADSDSLPRVYVALQSEPAKAMFVVDGERIDGASVSLGPGRHVIEAKMHGYSPRLGFVEVKTDGSAPARIRLSLEPLPDDEAWMALRRLLSEGASRLEESGVPALFARFGLDRIVLLERGKGEVTPYLLRLATPGTTETLILPAVSSPEDLLEETFSDALSRAFGVEPVAEDEGPIPSPVDPDALEDDVEDDSVRLDELPDSDEWEGKGDASKVFKSPWFWVSVGVVIAVVGGVVIGTQINQD